VPPLSREQLAARRTAQRAIARRRRRRGALTAALPLLAVALVSLALGLAGGGATSEAAGPKVASPVLSVDPGTRRPPPRQVLARAEGVEILLPVHRERLTAIGYHPVDDAATVELQPASGIDYGELSREGRSGPAHVGLDVGAPAGTVVFSPVDGVISSVEDFVVAGRAEGYELMIEPATAGGLALRVSHLEPAPGVEAPSVGEAVAAGTTVIGAVRDFSGVADQQLSELTSDSGNHVDMELVRAGSVAP
jgi:murein DD-endopeptidase MepM/ murein hydrolase activator NlpD